MRTLSPATVQRYLDKLDVRGKHGYAFRANEVRDEPYVLVWVSLDDLNVVEPEYVDAARVARYAARPTPLPPVLGSYGARSARRGERQIVVLNGNHRAHAAQVRGESAVRVILPQTDWERWRTRPAPG